MSKRKEEPTVEEQLNNIIAIVDRMQELMDKTYEDIKKANALLTNYMKDKQMCMDCTGDGHVYVVEDGELVQMDCEVCEGSGYEHD